MEVIAQAFRLHELEREGLLDVVTRKLDLRETAKGPLIEKAKHKTHLTSKEMMYDNHLIERA